MSILHFVIVLPVLAFALVLPLHSHAQNSAGQIESADQLLDDQTLDRRVDLARQMHQIRPAKDQVDTAIEQVTQALPPSERDAFRIAMRQVLNYQAIENISINAMAETYTLQELEALVDYHSKPEAKSAGDKYGTYAGKVQPEIVQMIDKAIMHIRTGGN